MGARLSERACVWSMVLCFHASQEEVVIASPHGRDMVVRTRLWATL